METSGKDSRIDWILIVDDDEGLCELASRALMRKGYSVETAGSGRSALDAIERLNPALMLLDYRLPDMTGEDLVRSLKDSGSDLPFVMMTGQGDEQLAVSIMKLGAADYLIKDTELIDRLPPVVGRIFKSIDVNRKLAKAEDELRLAANVFTHSSEGILITDSNAVIVEVNPAFTEITGYSREEALGKNPRMLQSGRHGAEFYAALWRSLAEEGHWSGEVWNRSKDGKVFCELLTISSVRSPSGETGNYIAQFSDITALKEYQSQLERIAHFDSLTGLPNRLLLSDRMTQAMAQAPRRALHIAIVYLDLDGFKAVNDAHGHETGDLLLAALASRMTQALREGDTLARLGGDEFVAVLVDLNGIDASLPILTRLLEAAAQPVTVGDITLRVSASLGVSVFPQRDEVDADQLLRQADQAMYQAKQSGKNRFHIFDSEHDRNVRGRYESLKRIQNALAAREFVLYYQPKVNMHTGALIGAEALIRWQHPELGLVPPSDFLPIIENHPLSIELGEWVIDTALGQIESWRAEGLRIPVSVNVGALQLQHPDFAPRLRDLISAHPGAVPGDLELEILETSALDDIGIVSALMETCRSLGVGFALDDFGTGYSSLLYLKQLPAGMIKIDQSFIRDILDDPEDIAILDGVVALAAAFRRNLIAEGVETVAHGEILLCMGCELAQGYAISRPMPAAAFTGWMGTWQAPPAWKNLKELPKNRIPYLIAAIEHRSWASAVESRISGTAEDQSLFDHETCRLCGLLRESEDIPSEAAACSIRELHSRSHRLAGELFAMKGEGRAAEAESRCGELRELAERILGLMVQ